jgi:hypothetical protein
MKPMDELIQAVLKSYGLVGVFMVSPVAATVYLWLENRRLNTKMQDMSEKFSNQIDSMGQRVVAAQDKRIEDSARITTQLVQMVTESVGSAKDTAVALDRVGDMVSMVGGQINALNSHISGQVAPTPMLPTRSRLGGQ